MFLIRIKYSFKLYLIFNWFDVSIQIFWQQHNIKLIFNYEVLIFIFLQQHKCWIVLIVTHFAYLKQKKIDLSIADIRNIYFMLTDLRELNNNEVEIASLLRGKRSFSVFHWRLQNKPNCNFGKQFYIDSMVLCF